MTGSNNNLEKIVINPNNQNQVDYIVIWLHGLGADGNDFVPIVPELNLPANHNVKFVFPHAPTIPVTINNGYVMPAWFDIYGLDKNSREDSQGIELARTQINHLIEDEHSAGIPYQNIALAGFSQGGALALFAGLKFWHKLAGIIALSCYLPQFDQNYSDANKDTPIMLAHGSDDQVVLELFGHAARNRLLNLDYKVNWHSYKMGHQVCFEEIQDIAKFMHKIFPLNDPLAD